MPHVLIIEDEELLARNLREAIEYSGHRASTESTGEKGIARIRESDVDLVLLDLRLPQLDGLEVLQTIRNERLGAPVIVMTAHGSIDVAVEAMKLGAREFLTKPLDLRAVQILVDRVLEQERMSASLDYYRNRDRQGQGVDCIVGDSPSMVKVRENILRLVRSPGVRSAAPPAVLITGETGTGKDLVARAIHYEGPRCESPFIHVNCTAIPDELFESELFGHVKGAFTSAQGSKKGLMEVADGGTIFLDEIGHMKLSLQAKLLTAIEQKRIRPVGATHERTVDVHIVSATNRDLVEAVDAGEFRDDLYHRLRVFVIEMPPLKQRIEDILPLTNFLVARHVSNSGIDIRGVSPDAINALENYDWPGNVRELSHVLESAVLMCDQHLIKPEHLQIHAPATDQKLEVSIAGREPIEVDFTKAGSILADVEHALIDAAVEYSRYNISRAARILGITREAVRYRLRKHSERKSGDPDSSAP